MKELIKNGRIISPLYDSEKLLDIYIEKGAIIKIGENLQEENAFVTDAEGNYILPGLIDMHCNICDPGYEYIEDIETASMSAVKGGFTTITCEPNTKPAIDNKTVVEYIVSKSKMYSLVNIFPYGSMSIGCKGEEMSEIGEMHQAGIVGISNGNSSVENAGLLRNIFLYSKMFHLPVITHCEDKSLSKNGVMNDGFVSTCLGLRGIPKEAEEIIVARNIVLAENVGNSLHIAHVSTKGSIQLIREAKKRGVPITCEVCPHHFILTEESVCEYNTLVKVKPPLRTQADKEALLEGLADGTVDTIASGHNPTNLTDKNKEFDNADYGISAFETAFALSYTELVETKILTLPQLVEKMSYNPASILNFSKKGKIQEGMDADLIIVNLKDSYKIDSSKFYSKAKFSPFDGKLVKGNILYSVVGGRVIF